MMAVKNPSALHLSSTTPDSSSRKEMVIQTDAAPRHWHEMATTPTEAPHRKEMATQTEQPRTREVATQTEPPRGVDVATQTNAPFGDVVDPWTPTDNTITTKDKSAQTIAVPASEIACQTESESAPIMEHGITPPSLPPMIEPALVAAQVPTTPPAVIEPAPSSLQPALSIRERARRFSEPAVSLPPVMMRETPKFAMSKPPVLPARDEPTEEPTESERDDDLTVRVTSLPEPAHEPATSATSQNNNNDDNKVTRRASVPVMRIKVFEQPIETTEKLIVIAPPPPEPAGPRSRIATRRSVAHKPGQQALPTIGERTKEQYIELGPKPVQPTNQSPRRRETITTKRRVVKLYVPTVEYVDYVPRATSADKLSAERAAAKAAAK